MDREIRVLTVSENATEKQVTEALAREFKSPVTVFQYEDYEHDRVTVGSANWLEEAFLMYNHIKAKKRSNEVVALKVFLKKQQGYFFHCLAKFDISSLPLIGFTVPSV